MSRSFNGSSDILTNATAVTGMSSFSASFWALITGAPGANVTPFSNGDANSGYYFYVPSGTLNLHCVVPFRADVDLLASLSANTWTHIAMTYNGTNYIAYKNGAVMAGTPFNIGDPLDLGAQPYIGGVNGNNFWPGNLQDCAFWNVPLTAGEVGALARGMRPNKIRPTGLVRWWPIDGLASPEPDLSGNKLNLTVTGTALAAGAPLNLISPKRPNFLDAAVASTAKFRRTLSPMGTRIGSRQRQVA